MSFFDNERKLREQRLAEEARRNAELDRQAAARNLEFERQRQEAIKAQEEQRRARELLKQSEVESLAREVKSFQITVSGTGVAKDRSLEIYGHRLPYPVRAAEQNSAIDSFYWHSADYRKSFGFFVEMTPDGIMIFHAGNTGRVHNWQNNPRAQEEAMERAIRNPIRIEMIPVHYPGTGPTDTNHGGGGGW